MVGWLRPGDFADPAHGQIYRCLGSLHHRGEPIDRITVLWEAQRRGLLADGTLTAEQLTEICDGVGPGSAEWLGEQVMRSTITRTAAASARAIRALAQNEALAPGRLISHALHALGPLDEVRARWRTARNPDPARHRASDPESSTARIQAALARSAPRPAARPPDGSGPTTGSTAARRPPAPRAEPPLPLPPADLASLEHTMNDDHSSEAALLRFVGSSLRRPARQTAGERRRSPLARSRCRSHVRSPTSGRSSPHWATSSSPLLPTRIGRPAAPRMRTSFTAVLQHAGDAISALGTAVHQLALLDEEAPLRDQRDVEGAEKAAAQAVAEALSRADAALGDAGDLLHAAATSTTARRLHAARSQSPAASPLPGPPLPPAPPSTGPANRTARGR